MKILLESSDTSLKLLIEILMEEINTLDTMNEAFENRDESKVSDSRNKVNSFERNGLP